ncbi:hypothetical protein [Intrasporangium sp. YIM S08009]|uniref:hypothetical protein n=1 Tax=Intrasporangium zincisolvens TaxID=3080018 RepID=UPI002B06213B|nr:hypothetical protein [Intrasporangium sp. YIM S08009]
MTTTQLVEETLSERAGAVCVPPVSTNLVVARARRVRRHRTSTGLGAVAAAVAVAVAVGSHLGATRAVSPTHTNRPSMVSTPPDAGLYGWAEGLPHGPALDVTSWPAADHTPAGGVVLHVSDGDIPMPAGVIRLEQPRSIPGGWLFTGVERGDGVTEPSTTVIRVDTRTGTARVVARQAFVGDLLVDADARRFAYTAGPSVGEMDTLHVVDLAGGRDQQVRLPAHPGLLSAWQGERLTFVKGSVDLAVLDLDSTTWSATSIRPEFVPAASEIYDSRSLAAYDGRPDTLLVTVRTGAGNCIVAVRDSGADQRRVACASTGSASVRGPWTPMRIAPGGRWMVAVTHDGTKVFDLRTLAPVSGLPPQLGNVNPFDVWWETRDTFVGTADSSRAFEPDVAYRWNVPDRQGERFDGNPDTEIGRALGGVAAVRVPNL